MCKVYNINRNKIADICFYHYIDEIIYVKKKKSTSPQPAPLVPPFRKILISIVEKKM